MNDQPGPLEHVRRIRRDRHRHTRHPPSFAIEINALGERERHLDCVMGMKSRLRIPFTRRRTKDPQARTLPEQDASMRFGSPQGQGNSQEQKLGIIAALRLANDRGQELVECS